MGRLCPTGPKDIGNQELEERSTQQTGMVGASEEGQGSQRAVVPLMMMMMMGKEVEIIQEMEKCKIPLLGISETNRKGKGEMEMDTSYDIQVRQRSKS